MTSLPQRYDRIAPWYDLLDGRSSASARNVETLMNKPSSRDRKANTILSNSDLDRRDFFLDPEAHERFLAMLDAPPRSSPELRALYNRKPTWDR